MLDDRLLKLKERLMAEASLVEKMVDYAIQGISKKDKHLLDEVMNNDEDIVDDLELEIDRECLNLFALYQPEARDLRTLLMVLKMNNDLERVGDLAVNICQSASYLIERPEIKDESCLISMGEQAKLMLSDSIRSFVDKDVELANDVYERDDVIDDAGNNILIDFLDVMMENKSNIERCLHILRISRNFERIADLSTNIAEDVIFMVSGEVIRSNKKNNT